MALENFIFENKDVYVPAEGLGLRGPHTLAALGMGHTVYGASASYIDHRADGTAELVAPW